MTFEELAREFREWYTREKAPKTIACYESSLKKLLKRFSGQDIAAVRLKNGAEAGLTALDKRVLKRMLHLAKEWEYLSVVPVIHIPNERKRTRFFSAQELDDLFHECYDPDLLMVIRLGMGTGLRKKDLLSLKWSQIDFDQKIIRVIQKGGIEHWVPFDPGLIPHLQKYWEARGGAEAVFPPKKDYAVRLKTLCKRLGIKNVTFHTLRHSYGSWLALGGTDIKTIAELMGHTSIQTTARYIHISTEAKRAAVAKLPGIISAGGPNETS